MKRLKCKDMHYTIPYSESCNCVEFRLSNWNIVNPIRILQFCNVFTPKYYILHINSSSWGFCVCACVCVLCVCVCVCVSKILFSCRQTVLTVWSGSTLFATMSFKVTDRRQQMTIVVFGILRVKGASLKASVEYIHNVYLEPCSFARLLHSLEIICKKKKKKKSDISACQRHLYKYVLWIPIVLGVIYLSIWLLW